jgi:hypothetical protein
LVPTVDSLRTELLPAFGVRAQRVFLVRRTWSGSERGAGTVMVNSDVEMLPPPLLDDSAPRAEERRYELKSHGRDEEGEIEASEISLTYTEDELTGGVIPDNVEFYWRVVDAHGQGQHERYYVPSRPPRVDRVDAIGWSVVLKRCELAG